MQLQWRYERTREMKNLDELIAKAQVAVRLIPSDHPDLAPMLSNLGLVLQRRYTSTGVMSNLENAIKIKEKAAHLTPADHPTLAGRLINLTTKVRMLSDRTERSEYLDRAIEQAELAAKATPSDHPDLAMHLDILGRQQYKSTNPLLPDRAVDSWLRSWKCVNGIPSKRLPAAIAAINLLQN